MSTTAVGITLDLDGPLPVARRYSLLATPGVVVSDSGRWMNGIQVAGYPDGVPTRWEPCSTGTFRVKDESVGNSVPGSRFDPIAVYFPVSCSTHGMSNSAVQDLADRVETVLDATLSFGVEEAFAKGTTLSVNPFLADGNMVALASGAAVSPKVGQGYLENAIGELTGRQGVIHATPAVVSAWGMGDNLNLSNDPITEGPPALGLRTTNGTPVISGAGYIGAHPTGETAPGATTDWVFATGLVEVRLESEQRTEIVEAIDQTTNDIVIRAERWVLPDWDQALQVGVLIDWSL